MSDSKYKIYQQRNRATNKCLTVPTKCQSTY